MTKTEEMWAAIENAMCSACGLSQNVERAIEEALAEQYRKGASDNAQHIREQLTKVARTPDIPHMSAVSTERIYALASPGQLPAHVRERSMGDFDADG